MNLKNEIGDLENKILEVKRKRQFSQLPNSIIKRALEKTDGDIKGARMILRKYFGVFLTNRVLKSRDVLKSHLSTKKRDYDFLYRRLADNVKRVRSVIDIGAGGNGFSYGFLRKYFGNVRYVGIEAVGQLVKNMTRFFEAKGFNGVGIWLDIFDLEKIKKIVSETEKKRMVFLFQVVDALEGFERDYSLKLIKELDADFFAVSVPLKSLSGGLKKASGKWIFDFINTNFFVIDRFAEFGEDFILFSKE